MSDISVKSVPAPRPAGETGAALLAVGGIAAAFSAASCCALPMLLGSFGLGSAWLFGLALLAAPHRLILLAAAAACLAGGAALLWRRRAAACAPGTACSSNPALRHLTGVGLALGSVLLVLGYLYA
jgi:mercuric ion transport protein